MKAFRHQSGKNCLVDWETALRMFAADPPQEVVRGYVVTRLDPMIGHPCVGRGSSQI